MILARVIFLVVAFLISITTSCFATDIGGEYREFWALNKNVHLLGVHVDNLKIRQFQFDVAVFYSPQRIDTIADNAMHHRLDPWGFLGLGTTKRFYLLEIGEVIGTFSFLTGGGKRYSDSPSSTSYTDGFLFGIDSGLMLRVKMRAPFYFGIGGGWLLTSVNLSENGGNLNGPFIGARIDWR